MKLSINWIKKYIDLPEMSPKELGEKFTLSVCEVEEVIKTGELLKTVKVAEVISTEPHPDADKLRIVTFNAGNGEQKVVCGAPNVRPGIKVPFAPVGTCFPDGFCLVPKKIRGVMSEGMLCSEVELGIGDDASGLLELPDSSEIGMSMSQHLSVEVNILFDIDNKSITHRPDLWGHYGMAREFAALFGKKLENRYDSAWMEGIEKRFVSSDDTVKIKVDEDSACLAYYGLTVKGVKVGDSPDWMKQTLTECGLRPINNIVDISNYVMLEFGIPNHIFDKNLIEGKQIVVRRAGEKQVFVTLDEEERALIPHDTVVCDTTKPLVIGGIMGGSNSGVSEDTQDVFVEVANWVDSEVRKTSTRIGLRTDSSQRYEKCLDSMLCRRTLYRIVELIQELCPGAEIMGKVEFDGKEFDDSYTPVVIELTTEYICSSLGKKLEDKQIVDILTNLDFVVENSDGNLRIIVPSYRATKDVSCDADIVEEIGRMIGFDNIDPVSPEWGISAVRLSEAKKLHRRIQDFLSLQTGALEVLTYPMVGDKLISKAGWGEQSEDLRLVNAIAEERSLMRPSLVPGFLEMAALNQKNFDKFTAFEIGRSYQKCEKDFSDESNQVVIALFDKSRSRFVEALDLVEQLLSHIKINGRISPMRNEHPLVDVNWKGLHPHETQDIAIMGKSRGFVTTVHPIVCREFKIKGKLTLAVIDLKDFEEKEIKSSFKFKPLPKYPESVFDVTVVAETRTPVADVLKPLGKLKVKELISSKILDVFKIDDNSKSVTIRNRFFDEKKTLDGDVIKEAETKIIEALNKAGYPLR